MPLAMLSVAPLVSPLAASVNCSFSLFIETDSLAHCHHLLDSGQTCKHSGLQGPVRLAMHSTLKWVHVALHWCWSYIKTHTVAIESLWRHIARLHRRMVTTFYISDWNKCRLFGFSGSNIHRSTPGQHCQLDKPKIFWYEQMDFLRLWQFFWDYGSCVW